MRTRWFGRIVLGWIVAAAAAAGPAGASEAIKMFRAPEPVAIDGRLDEACWKAATPVRIDFISGKRAKLSDEKHGVALYAWDDRYLYIGYETFDTNLIALGSGEVDGPVGNEREGAHIWFNKWGGMRVCLDAKGNSRVSMDMSKVDIAEFFISFGDKNFFWELHHNAANQFNDVFCVLVPEDTPFRKSSTTPHGILFVPEKHLADDGDDTVEMAVSLTPKEDGAPSTINDDTDKDTGYSAEIRIPWNSLGPPKDRRRWKEVEKGMVDGKMKIERIPLGWDMDGQPMRIIATVQDGDQENRYHHSSADFPGGWFHKAVDGWNAFVLTRETGGAEAKSEDKAPGDQGVGDELEKALTK